MKRIIALLNEKNHYLEKFYALTEKELPNFAAGQFDNLEYFYQTRERILETLKYVDSHIERVQIDLEKLATEHSADIAHEVREALAIKDAYVGRIVEQDIQVLACIEKAKNSLIRELQDIRQSRKAVGGYKSKVFHNRLNEEV